MYLYKTLKKVNFADGKSDAKTEPSLHNSQIK